MSVSGSVLELWDPGHPLQIDTQPGSPISAGGVIMSPDGRYFAAGSGIYKNNSAMTPMPGFEYLSGDVVWSGDQPLSRPVN